MHKKLARHFAQNACDNAMDQFIDLFEHSAGGVFDI